MTTKNITASAVAAAILSTSALATVGGGTLTYVGGSGTSTTTYTIAKELIDFADQNNTAGAFAVAKKLQYKTSTIPNGSISKPAITLKLTGGIFAGTTWSDINISDAATGSTIGTYKAGAGTSELAIEPDASGSITSNNELNITSTLGQIQLTKGSTGVSMEVVVGYSTDPSAADSGSKAIIDTVQEYTATVSTLFDNKIDASNSFYSFTNPATPLATTDTTVVTLAAQTANIDSKVGATTLNQTIASDVNTSVYVTAAGGVMSGAHAADTASLNDSNVTIASTGAATIANNDTITTTYTVPNTKEIKVTNFTNTLTHTSATIGTATLLSAADSGKWVIYGYTAQIPNVVSNATINCALKFTNRSTIESEVYFTLIDPDGTTVPLSSVANPTIAKLAADTTGTYNSSDLLALVTDTNFDKTGSFSVEVAIPTTPNSVYGMASFNNTTVGKFYALPVYNSSTMSY